MKEVIRKYTLIKWWIPILAFSLSVVIYIRLISSTNHLLSILSNFLLLSSIALLLIAGVWELIKGKWYWSILQLMMLFFGVAGLIFVTLLVAVFEEDTFADNLAIPNDIKIEYPVDLKTDENFEEIRPDSLNSNSIIHFNLDYMNLTFG